MPASFVLPPSRCTWYDGSGTAHEIEQGEEGQQGETTMPALLLAIQPAPREVEGLLQDGGSASNPCTIG